MDNRPLPPDVLAGARHDTVHKRARSDDDFKRLRADRDRWKELAARAETLLSNNDVICRADWSLYRAQLLAELRAAREGKNADNQDD